MMSANGVAVKGKALWDFLVPETWLLALVSVAFGAAGASPTPAEWALLFISWGPLWTGATNLINMYIDREEDAINDPKREGVDREMNVRVLGYPTILATSLVFFAAAVLTLWMAFGHTVGLVAIAATAVSVGYSMPPLRFKRHYLTSTPSLSVCAVILPFLSGWALHSPLKSAPVDTLAFVGVAIAHALVGKEIPDYEGDKEAGHATVVTRFGFERGVRLFLLGYPAFYLTLGVAVATGVLPSRFAAAFLLVPVSTAVTLRLWGLQKDDDRCQEAFVLTFFHGLLTAVVLYAISLGAWSRLAVVGVGVVLFLALNRTIGAVLNRASSPLPPPQGSR